MQQFTLDLNNSASYTYSGRTGYVSSKYAPGAHYFYMEVCEPLIAWQLMFEFF